ncbi:MAG: hypothetical protein ABI042_00060 [Verrucomicrobiota bacterium]
MKQNLISRRRMLGQLALAIPGGALLSSCAAFHQRKSLRLSSFSADVTPPAGIGMMGGAWLSTTVADPLEAHGFVLLGPEAPVVFVAVDWCEIRNDAYARWQKVLAAAAQTTPDRVMVMALHQHDAPIADLTAERILREKNLAGTICDPEFHERAVQNVAAALRKSLSTTRVLTHIGSGEARVEKVSSNRRYVTPGGEVRFDRTSSTKNPVAIEADEGLTDPWLKTLTFWSGDQAVVALNFFAVHPMSYYGSGEVSADFPGLARRRRQAETPGTKQIYCSGCSGNLTAGKYNNGDPQNRALLAERLHRAMKKAWQNTKRQPVDHSDYRVTPLELKPRESAGFTQSDLDNSLTHSTKPFQQCLAAMGLSWRKRVGDGIPLQIPALDFGFATILLLPGEAYVEFQLAAQRMRPNSFVCVAGYGDAPAGYIPTEQHIAERDTNLGDWCWIEPGSETRLLSAIKHALKK